MKRLGIVALVLVAVATGVSCSEASRPGSGSGANGLDGEDGGVLDDGGASTSSSVAAAFTKTVLQSEQTDPNLVNPWGLAFNETAGPAWIANAGTGTSSVFGPDNALLLSVTVPAPRGIEKSAPTGIVFNPDTAAFKGDVFVFVTEEGSVAGWQPGTGAALRFANEASGAVYKGATIATVAGKPRLFATNFRDGRIDVYDENYAPLRLAEGAFTDTSIPAGFAPFNADAIGNLIFVTYAKQDEAGRDDVPGAGNGYLDAFDVKGNLVARLASGGTLDSPWGMAVTPDDYGPIPHRLLVGNFGDGRINVFDVELAQAGLRAVYGGQLGDEAGQPLAVEGLWALRFPKGAGFDPAQLYFTAGPGDERRGEYGRLDLVRTPGGDAGDAGEAGEAGPTEDAGPTTDAGIEDAAPAEDAAPVEDAGAEDAATEDASTEDASTEDASTEDASTEDASTEDASTEDASTPEVPITPAL